MEKGVYHEIAGLINSFNEQLAQQMPLLEDEINGLISSGETDNNTIENYLDTLLSLTMHGFGDALFIRLLEYYKTINLEGAMFYWNEYDKQES
jgi:hypothetical protein